MIARLSSTVLAGALATITLAPAAAAAHPAAQHVLSRGRADHVQRVQAAALAPYRADRVLYGRIDAIHGNVLLVRSRSGRLESVDAGPALRTGAYSAPLFVGKLVLIAGYADAQRALHAQSITRETRIDAKTAADR